MSMPFLYHIFPSFVRFVLYLANISGERLQDHWSSVFSALQALCRRRKAKALISLHNLRRYAGGCVSMQGGLCLTL